MGRAAKILSSQVLLFWSKRPVPAAIEVPTYASLKSLEWRYSPGEIQTSVLEKASGKERLNHNSFAGR